MWSFGIFRINRDADAKHMLTIRDRLARSMEILRSVTIPDTFLGRKTQKLFPQEGNEAMARWMASKELQPPK
jgi:hypothetical protein